MKRYQIALISFALGILVFTTLGVYFLKNANQEIIAPKPPIVLEYSTVRIFFPNSIQDPLMTNCGRTYPVERAVSRLSENKRTALAEYSYLAISELLKGPVGYEKDNGYFTLLNKDSKLEHITIENKVATVDFNDKFNTGVAGSCKIEALRSQISETLKQFPGIDDVKVTVNGKDKDVLKP